MTPDGIVAGVPGALAAGYKLKNKWVKYCKLGDSFIFTKEGFDDIGVTIMGTDDMALLGLRFPYQRRGQWNNPQPLPLRSEVSP